MGKTLLLADDSVTIQKVVGISFASEDIAITTVDNGDDAISKARELQPDVILADVVMPGKSGYEVCEAVKADPNLQHIPVLLLTGTFEAFDEARAESAGAAGQVAKPFEAQTLVERVKDLLAQAPIAVPADEPPPATRPASAAASPGSSAADNAFDFFDDPVSSEAPAALPTTAPVIPEPARPEFDLENPDAAFAFGDDELPDEGSTEVVEPAARQVPPPPAAHTVAILPEDPQPLAGATGAPPPLQPAALERKAPPALPLAPPPVPAPAPAAGTTGAESYDFEFERVGTQTTPPPEPPRAAVAESQLLDPQGDSPYDVSSSELDRLVGAAPDAGLPPEAATQLLETPFPGAAAALGAEPSPPGTMQIGDDPVMEMLAADPADSGPASPPTGFVEERPTAAPSRPEPVFPSTDTAAQEARSAWPEPPSAIPPEAPPGPWPADPPTPEPRLVPVEALSPAVPEPEPAESGPTLPDDALAQIAPALQEQLHETLEKIAWEAFGQVTETVVEQAVERLEKIAWEVVPKLAETLIQEEIRKLKGQ